MQQNILYIHGFNSSPLSQKAIETKTYIESHFPEVGFYSPQVANTPAEAVKQFHNIITSQPNAQWFVMGSSLGGYFSTYLSEFYQIKAVLVNPAIKPFELLTDALGEHSNPYTEQTYEVTTAHLDELQSCFQTSINAERYFVMSTLR